MADKSANESVNSSKFSIIKNSGILGDLASDKISIWRSEDISANHDNVNRRLIREQAKQEIDKIIIGKIEELEKNILNETDDNLEKILQKRQAEREDYRGTSHRRQARKDKHYVDNRLDMYVDCVVNKFSSKMDLMVKHSLLAISTCKVTDNIIKGEASLSIKMSLGVEKFDILLDKFLNDSVTKLEITKKRAHLLGIWCKSHKKQFMVGTSVAAAVALSSSLIVDSITAYEYMYNGKTLGIVKNQKDVYNTVEVIGDKLSCTYGAEIRIDKEKDIGFRKTTKIGKQLDSGDDVLNRFTYLKDMNATAYAIKVDGRQKAVLYSKECAEGLLNEIKGHFMVDNTSVTYETIGFAENVEIVEVNTKIGRIDQEDKVLDYMLTGAVEIKTYEIQAGDTFSEIAKNKGMSMEELMAANSGVNPERLQIGQELILNRVCPVVTVQTTEIAEYIAPIEYEIIYEETSTLYKGEQTVKSTGKKGEKEVVAQIIRNNGEEISRNELSVKIITEPKSQIVLKGIKDPPPLIGTGRFIYPTRGRLTSRFGTRWGRMHNGIDLAAPTGTKIRAADGGVVISAGWEGSLGYCVRINHGQNKTTVYGHCSKLLVKKGDKVYQDQHIANIGNTGRSTGPHLHFEVHINGVPQNPLKYLP